MRRVERAGVSAIWLTVDSPGMSNTDLKLLNSSVLI